ncbi:GNAT family N-acetyltransferase [Phototrophicus methaneseepsis]|uniref:GNAT family N-acetyltransferase n=1 Tax=Phototrophicus methaneseepsis TaxID=2710758 RepID=A0A7S8EAL8_9CHLR|nr:GNAT family N-acetyltransferase [Phototrophicus methaneseepsis]QPC83455.1 GNAT family N-acetyltransferase [Phototrophicus methaneseepsis]
MLDKALVLQLEHLAFRAMPALKTEDYDGWLLRFADGYTGRANSVNPLEGGDMDLHTKIDYCEARYDQEGMATLFRLTDIYQPVELEEELIKRGYQRRIDAPVGIYTAPVTVSPITINTTIKTFSQPEMNWLQPYTMLAGTPSRAVPTLQNMLNRIEDETCFAIIQQGEETLAAGMGVYKDGWVGVFNIVVGSRHRRQGLGRALVQSLLNWGAQGGAENAYLQVVLSNEPALALYSQLGFSPLYRYWYRLKIHSDQL